MRIGRQVIELFVRPMVRHKLGLRGRKLPFLLEHRGRIASKDAIGATLYGTGSEVEPNAVELLVSRLRRKLSGTGVEIRTARGLGYMLDAESDP